MNWERRPRADPICRDIADRHYSRKTVGASCFTPPGRVLILLSLDRKALWATSYPLAEYVRHAWAGAWICSIFRNEGSFLSSELIREAIAVTRWQWPDVPAMGMITFVDAGKVKRKRDPGRCFLRAGFNRVGHTQGGLIVLQMTPAEMPPAAAPFTAQLELPELRSF